MVYIGNRTSQGYVTITKDSFSGNNSNTDFTLSKSATVNEIEVFVENVRQEPTTAYTVSGTTLSFTGTPPTGTNNIYVVHSGNTVSSSTYPSTYDLSAAKGTFTGTVDINGNELILDADADTSITADTDDAIDFKVAGSDVVRIDSSGNLSLGNGTNTNDGIIHINAGASAKNIVFEGDRANDGQGLGNVQFHNDGTNVVQISGARGSTAAKGDLVFYTNGGSLTERMRIDEDGHITKPTTSAFLCIPASNQNDLPEGVNVDIAFGTEVFDQNDDFASSVFTAPVTGRYFLSTTLYTTSLDASPVYVEAKIVTSNRTYYDTIDPRGFDADLTYYTIKIATLADMDAGDTAKVQMIIEASGTVQQDIVAGAAQFSGFLAC